MPIGSMVYAETLYAYDNQGRLYQVKDNGAVIATYAYDANGNRHSLTYVNGVTATYGYNLSNLVTSLENKKGTTALSKYTYTYLLDGNQRTKTDHTGLVTTYCYDGLGRLTNEQESTGQSLAYGYDSFGNRASLTASGPESYTTTYQYDLNNRLTTETKEQGGDTLIKDYQYDANGNTVSILPSLLTDANGGTSSLSLNTDLDGATLNQYDGVNRLVQVETGETTATYTYRPDGLRSTKTVNGVTTTYVWDGSSLVMELTDGAVTGKYLRGVGLIAGQWGGLTSYYAFNAHGDVTGLTNPSGTLTKTYDYDAFGNEKTASDANDTNPFRYCGEYWDKETGSYYLRARYYQPGLGRFLSEDPVRAGLNWYMYRSNNPVNFIDPLGLVEVGLRAYAATYEGSTVSWDQETGYATVVYGQKTLRVKGTSDNIRDGYLYVDDSIFVNAFGIGGKLIVYQDAVTNNVSIRGSFSYRGEDAYKTIPGTESSPGLGGTSYQRAFLQGIEEYWSGMFGEYEVSTYARYHGDGIKVLFNDKLGVSNMWGGLFGWSTSNPGKITMYSGDSRGNGDLYAIDQFKWVSAHEFGHILGVGDAYNSKKALELLAFTIVLGQEYK